MKDVLSILEVAYATAPDADTWLRRTVAALRPHLDRGAGVFAHRFEHRADGFHMDRPVGGSADDRWWTVFERVAPWAAARRNDPIWSVAHPRAPVATTITALTGSRLADVVQGRLADPSSAYDRELRGALLSCRDVFGLVASDPSGHGCAFYAPSPRSIRATATTLEHWQRIAVHLAAGYRLARGCSADPDAVLSERGTLLEKHAGLAPHEGAALTRAARAIELARGALRRVDPARAVEIWKGLVAGRWSLVEHFDHDGRRYLVARRNAVDLPSRPWGSLRERELQAVALMAHGHPLKLAAYELGVSAATVSGDLARARRKLGVRTRLELVTAYRAYEASLAAPGKGAV